MRPSVCDSQIFRALTLSFVFSGGSPSGLGVSSLARSDDLTRIPLGPARV